MIIRSKVSDELKKHVHFNIIRDTTLPGRYDIVVKVTNTTQLNQLHKRSEVSGRKEERRKS
jgi:hypothetical protein